MKKIIFIAITITFCLLLINSCSKKSQDIVTINDDKLEILYLDLFNNDTYDLIINIKFSQNRRNNIAISANGDAPIHFLSLKINNDNVSLDRFADNFDGYYNFIEGRNYNIEVNYNYNIFKSRLTMPFKVSINPAITNFDYASPYTITWESEKDNQLQKVNLHSHSIVDETMFSVYLPPEARGFTFEARNKTLQNGIIAVSVENINYIKQDRIFILAKVESYMDEISKQIYND